MALAVYVGSSREVKRRGCRCDRSTTAIDAPGKQNETGKKTSLTGREIARFFQVNGQPREIEIEWISHAKIYEAYEEKIGIEKLPPVDARPILLRDSPAKKAYANVNTLNIHPT